MNAPSSAILIAVLVLLALISAGVVALMLFRKRLLGPSRSTPDDHLSLADLRAMRARGQLSDSEFEAARNVLLRQLGHNPDSPPRSRPR